MATSLYAEIVGTAGILALISTRCYPLHLPQNPTLPAIVYQKIAGAPEQAHDGPTGINRTTYQVATWAETYQGALTLAGLVRTALDGFTGVLGGVGGVQCNVTLYNELEGQDAESGWYVIDQDYEIWHY